MIVMALSTATAFFSAASGFLLVLTGGYVAWRKLKPETTNIQVTTADRVVEIAVKTAEIAGDQRDDLDRQLREMRQRLDRFQERVQAAEERAEAAEARANTAEGRVRELTEENTVLRNRVAHLEDEVDSLKRGGQMP